jgi:hypothetical protein
LCVHGDKIIENRVGRPNRHVWSISAGVTRTRPTFRLRQLAPKNRGRCAGSLPSASNSSFASVGSPRLVEGCCAKLHADSRMVASARPCI